MEELKEKPVKRHNLLTRLVFLHILLELDMEATTGIVPRDTMTPDTTPAKKKQRGGRPQVVQELREHQHENFKTHVRAEHELTKEQLELSRSERRRHDDEIQFGCLERFILTAMQCGFPSLVQPSGVEQEQETRKRKALDSSLYNSAIFAYFRELSSRAPSLAVNLKEGETRLEVQASASDFGLEQAAPFVGSQEI
mmetsp:Transcript_49743/g.127967  ORF Transcript_49743/g.127967 Transcript_49743/m.127967 type:complete len:196 (+) Transcript_49743:241-828(+)